MKLMIKLKKIIPFALIALFASTLFLSAGTKKDKKEKFPPTTLQLWSFTDELEPVIDYFEERYPNVTIELSIIPTEDYPASLRYHFRIKDQTPDIFTGEAAFLRDFLDEGYFDNLEKDPYNVDTSSLIPYTVDFGRDPKTGAVCALSWQTTPGGYFYRRSIAKKVFKTDDPAVIGKKVATMRDFVETGRILKKRGYYLIPGLGDLSNTVMAQRTGPWIVDGKLNMEDVLIDYFDYAKTIREERLDAGIGQWSPAWFDSMKYDSRVFGQLLPTWGLHYVMKPNAPDSSGDWAVCQPPGKFFWGGTWIGVYKDSKNKEAAWEFVKMICLDPEFSKWYAEETGDVLSNIPVVDQIKRTFSDDYLDGQNHYAYFVDAAKEISGKLFSSYEQEINRSYFDQVQLYIDGEKTKDQAIADFKASVPEIIEKVKNTKKEELEGPLAVYVAPGSDRAKNTSFTGKLSLWSYTDELDDPIAYFEEMYPNVEIDYKIVPTKDYPSTIKPLLRSGRDAPDIFTGEANFLKEFLDPGFFDNLEKSPYNADVSSLFPYTVDFGRDTATGAVSALSWQVCPGGFIYRRSIAKEVFGTDDPAVIEGKVKTMESFIHTGRKLKEKGYYLVPGGDDLAYTAIYQRAKPWVVDGQLRIEDVMIDYFDMAKEIYDENLEAGIEQWAPEWFDSMKAESKVFGQLLPTWGLHYVIKPNAPDSSGDWAICRPPADYFWGGTWIGIYKNSKKKKLAWEFIKMLCLDPVFIEWWTKKTEDNTSHMGVAKKIQGSFSDEYLNGQNHYEYFTEAAKRIDGKLLTSVDLNISAMYYHQVYLYITGEKSKYRAIVDFKEDVFATYPDILVEF